MQDNYIRTNHSKHYLKANIILVCKYRKQLLVGQLKEDMHKNFKTIIDGSDFSVEVFESDLDHIYFLIRYIPRLSISQIVRRLKQQSTKLIWQQHPVSLQKQFWRKTNGFYAPFIKQKNLDIYRDFFKLIFQILNIIH